MPAIVCLLQSAVKLAVICQYSEEMDFEVCTTQHITLDIICIIMREPWSLKHVPSQTFVADKGRKIVPTGNISSPLPLFPPSLLYFPPSPPSPPSSSSSLPGGEGGGVASLWGCGDSLFCTDKLLGELGTVSEGKERDDSDEGKGGKGKEEEEEEEEEGKKCSFYITDYKVNARELGCSSFSSSSE